MLSGSLPIDALDFYASRPDGLFGQVVPIPEPTSLRLFAASLLVAAVMCTLFGKFGKS